MIKRLLATAALAGVLSACGSAPEVKEENASVAEVAAKVRDASKSGRFIRPGQWESTMEIQEFSVPGMPAAQARTMKDSIQRQQQGFSTCLTAEAAEEPKGGFFTGSDACRYEKFEMAKGKIDAVMRCPGPQSGQVLTMNGAYSPDTYDMVIAMRGEGENPADPQMSMKMHVKAKRVGECKPEVTQTAAG